LRAPIAVAVAALLGVTPAPAASSPEPPHLPLSPGANFSEQTGEALFANACQGCHMADGQGAAGAAGYPALARNPKLAAAGYPLTVVLHGLNGMPPIGRMMSDAQVAAVVNYLRTHFGNAYSDAVAAEDVASLRN
jgi:mono/diheme cytochrome c family protein